MSDDNPSPEHQRSSATVGISGGADLNSQGDMSIQGDVVGRDKLVSVNLQVAYPAGKLKPIDAQKKLRYCNLQKFRVWMESYRRILKCKYPEIFELWLSDAIAPTLGVPPGDGKFQRDKAIVILRDLREYEESKRIADKAREAGEDAFEALIERPSRFNLRARLLNSPDVYEFGTGFALEVISPLRQIHTQ